MQFWMAVENDLTATVPARLYKVCDNVNECADQSMQATFGDVVLFAEICLLLFMRIQINGYSVYFILGKIRAMYPALFLLAKTVSASPYY